MNASAKFLVLLDAARPALLIDRDKQLLGEVIGDDGSIVDSLLLVTSRTIIWSLTKQVRMGLVPLLYGLHRRFAFQSGLW